MGATLNDLEVAVQERWQAVEGLLIKQQDDMIMAAVG